ncbi:hypothetical protein BDY19DRAFT_427880 [Irpex rosettiformis]|uniref:Uncharacterized protein n=1 Tax=Irpex rosettiformis TaxID=378272 RepID=A0ACB8UGQ7_9APHY|nr:hypothetical protein BDY19DRAFT_427880 [Irpex rosettiformis]
MRSSNTALITLAVVLASTPSAFSAPALHLPPLFLGHGPVINRPLSTNTPLKGIPAPLEFNTNPATPSPVTAAVGFLPINPVGQSRRGDVEDLIDLVARQNQRRDLDDLIELLARQDFDESGAFSFRPLINGVSDFFKGGRAKQIGQAVSIGGDLLGIGLNVKSALAPAATPTAQPAPAATSAAAPVQARAFEELMDLLARADFEDEESGAFSFGKIFSPLVNIIGGLFGGGGSSPPPPPPPAPATTTSQPAQKRDISSVTTEISRRDVEDLIELVARAFSDDDQESGASFFSAVSNLFKDPKTLGRVATGLSIGNALSGLIPPSKPAPAPVAPAAAPPAATQSVVPQTVRSLNELD